MFLIALGLFCFLLASHTVSLRNFSLLSLPKKIMFSNLMFASNDGKKAAMERRATEQNRNVCKKATSHQGSTSVGLRIYVIVITH